MVANIPKKKNLRTKKKKMVERSTYHSNLCASTFLVGHKESRQVIFSYPPSLLILTILFVRRRKDGKKIFVLWFG